MQFKGVDRVARASPRRRGMGATPEEGIRLLSRGKHL